MMLWRLLSLQEEEEFKQWARDNWEYNSCKDQSTWHPISRMEWARLDYEAVKASNGIQVSAEDAAYFGGKNVPVNNNDNKNNINNDKNNIIIKFADQIPLIARKMFSGLDNDINWAILVILKDGDRSFSDLEKITALRKDILDNHIKKLIDSALIENYVQNKDGELKSFYEITLLALNILNSIDAWYWSDEEV